MFGLFGNKKATPTKIKFDNGASFVLSSKSISGKTSGSELMLSDGGMLTLATFPSMTEDALAARPLPGMTQATVSKQFGGTCIRGFINGFAQYVYLKEVDGCVYMIIVGGANPNKTDNNLAAIVQDFNATFQK